MFETLSDREMDFFIARERLTLKGANSPQLECTRMAKFSPLPYRQLKREEARMVELVA